jgi:hypothetical protein
LPIACPHCLLPFPSVAVPARRRPFRRRCLQPPEAAMVSTDALRNCGICCGGFSVFAIFFLVRTTGATQQTIRRHRQTGSPPRARGVCVLQIGIARSASQWTQRAHITALSFHRLTRLLLLQSGSVLFLCDMFFAAERGWHHQFRQRDHRRS